MGNYQTPKSVFNLKSSPPTHFQVFSFMLENLDLFFVFKKLWKITDLEYKIEEKEDPLSEELKAPFELCLLSSNQSPVFDHMS